MLTGDDTLLALSTSSAALSVAVFNGGRLLAAHHEVIGRGHAEALVALIARLTRETRLDRVARIVVDVGPGSFTGVRIGVAAARALALGWDASVTGCEAAALVAARRFAAAPELDETMVLLDAGRGQFYRQRRKRDSVSGRVEIVPADGERHDIPDALDALLLPPLVRGLPPAPVYVRPPDAVLPL